jgi:hypothetical protein
MTKRKLNRCRRALERFSINEARAAKDDRYYQCKHAELDSLQRTCRTTA